MIERNDDAGIPHTNKIPAQRPARLIAVLVACCCLATGIAIGAIARGIVGARSDDNRIAISHKPMTPDALSSIFARVAAEVEPSVVKIRVTAGDDRLSFGRGATGSGVIVNAAGFLLTNDHVIERAGKITVKLADGAEYRARIVGRDPQTDLAVLKIDPPRPLPAARVGDSEKLKVGDWVLAIGSPFGLEQTVTAGIISAKNRETGNNGQTPFQQFLQTDAAINPGNSGGPLLNLAGEVVGINTQIATSTGVNEGIGLALPSTTAVDVYNQIVTNGRVRRGFLGIQLGQLTPQISRQNKIADSAGVLVQSVTSDDSPAARAGLQSGDVIVSVNGQAVKTGPELTRLIASLPVGSPATIAYVRNGAQRAAVVKLEERHDDTRSELNFSSPQPDPGKDEADPPGVRRGIGFRVRTLTPELAKQRRLEGVRGVYVAEVEPGSIAEENGLLAGDVIIWVNYKEVTTQDDFQRLTAELKSGDDIILKVLRHERGPRRLAEIISFTLP